jgi:hypothetical protein
MQAALNVDSTKLFERGRELLAGMNADLDHIDEIIDQMVQIVGTGRVERRKPVENSSRHAMQHICSKMIHVAFFDSHGEIILDMQDPDTGQQIDHCPECGEEITQGMLFSLDFFPEVYAEMAEQQVEA